MVGCPPDARLLEASDLGLQESALTGKPVLVSRRLEPLLSPDTPGWSAATAAFPAPPCS